MKLINGSLSCRKVELAYSFFEKSLADKVVLNGYVYKNLLDEVQTSEIIGKELMIETLEKSIKSSNLNSTEIINNSENRNYKTQHESFGGLNRNSIIFDDNSNNNIKFFKKESRPFTRKNFEEEKLNTSNKENTNNFNFRQKIEEKAKAKQNTGPPKFIGLKKKENVPLKKISQQNDFGPILRPKNL